MAYLVLARKYRPQTFDEVVGQAHVTRTLKNAIEKGRVAHAMLFSGPRGTGKTTIARILAKAMNCESGATATPCNVCRSCSDITAGRGVDVFEIDGASNNSVDQIRELRENSRYMPAHSRYKIYIIDEVHMLSIAAFNALLKTLEEPPEHVLFFFATTEAHKIPVTILSRCQRHDLKRIDLDAVVDHLETICRQESVSVAADNLWVVARESGGSMRDALSLLDQILACGESRMDEGYVMRLLGSMDRQVLFDLSDAVFARDISRVLGAIDTVYKSGQDLKRFYADLLAHFRHLMLIKMGARPELLDDLAAGEIETLARQVKAVSTVFIDQVFTILFNAEAGIRYATSPRLALETAFFKIHQIQPALPIDLLIERLDDLLKQAPAVAASGIVESQSAYGQADAAAKVALPGPSAKTDLPAVEKPLSYAPEKSGAAADPGGSKDVQELWHRAVAVIGESKPSIAAALGRAQLGDVSDQEFTVVLHENGYTANLVKKNLAMVESVCREQTGRKVHIDLSDNAADEKNNVAEKQKADEIRQTLLNHPLVADAVEIFNGKIEEIKIG
ncbi:DNA polymerase III subunit gamma/tau [Desulfosarcina widdelii]|uniref:DNA polymerase III subunit gamma/tau n=1 Tax=Desulfosarcina widdelii TaxID=947919 RepID=A0A5K7ZDD9_9BACT|nr:DNA polymerase III subunit gamma/tau [Desulfosarcina widdelii]BBO79158.1 DNA polymerase III subunit gamma/tau [Desulfosarcina widdelii]